MPPTSPASRPGLRQRAFTLMEMVVVCAVLIVIAAAIVPNLIVITKSRSLKDLEGSIARLPAEARNEALRSQTPVHLRFSGTMLVMEQVPTDGSPVQVKEVDLGTDIQVAAVDLDGKPSDAGTWAWTVYPDGSADSGGVQFSEGQVQKALILPASGDARWVSGDLPDETQDQWPAGQLQQRT